MLIPIIDKEINKLGEPDNSSPSRRYVGDQLGEQLAVQFFADGKYYFQRNAMPSSKTPIELEAVNSWIKKSMMKKEEKLQSLWADLGV